MPPKRGQTKASQGASAGRATGRGRGRPRKVVLSKPEVPSQQDLSDHEESDHEEQDNAETSPGKPAALVENSSSDSESEQSGSEDDGGGGDKRTAAPPGRGARRAVPGRSTGEGSRSTAGPGKGKAAAKRSFSDMLGGQVDDASLRAAYKSVPGQRLAERAAVKEQLLGRAPMWHLLLRSGCSLLLHGLGSKREVVQEVAASHLTDGAVVVCNGWVKTLTAHKVLATAAEAIFGKSCRNVSGSDLIRQLRKEAHEWPDRRVYVVLHSIDGPGLRGEEEQALLGDMAACPNVHLLASCDHVNTPLMWSTALAAQFRWVWITAHTYAPLVAETMDRPSILLGCYQRSRQRGAGAVLRSMVENAREVFGLLVNTQLEDPDMEGLDFKQLFRMCRERFLLTSESALRAALTEFTDHELLATRQSSDGGGELLYVPLDTAGLQRLAKELEDIQAEAAGGAV